MIVRILLIAVGSFLGAVFLSGWRFSAPRFRGPRSDHFDGKRFVNLQPTSHSDFGEVARWMATRKPARWARWRDVTVAAPPAKRVEGGELRITWVNHATMLIQTEGLNILTDPIWSQRCSPVSWAGPKRHHAPGVRFEDLPPIDVVLISHNHYDHLDVPTLASLARDHRPQTFVALGNAAFLKGARELDWWQSAELAPDVRVHVVPAQHFSSRGLADRDANLWCGFVLETPHGPIYFAGDTGHGPHFAMIRERFGPMRVALLPIGAFRPEWFMGPVHLSPRDALEAARALEAKTAIPMHYFTFQLSDEGQDEPTEVLRREMRESDRFVILAPGETFSSP